ncbi:hypothetical protein NDU88_005722 [Pleurodeles waltl]|uniref:Uncharacterized protein n=1 Tax=Pleurodeles waltl TaxID=8319 RepID=A0AAV7QFK4_PLEWA|nr:hypothetical protein NDU88_005722 [Pleurodeles waltl]
MPTLHASSRISLSCEASKGMRFCKYNVLQHRHGSPKRTVSATLDGGIADGTVDLKFVTRSFVLQSVKSVAPDEVINFVTSEEFYDYLLHVTAELFYYKADTND